MLQEIEKLYNEHLKRMKSGWCEDLTCMCYDIAGWLERKSRHLTTDAPPEGGASIEEPSNALCKCGHPAIRHILQLTPHPERKLIRNYCNVKDCHCKSYRPCNGR